MKRNNKNKGRRRGVFVMIIAVGAFFFFGMSGLTVDAIYLYTLRGRLVTAVDACALAAARSIGKGQAEMDRIVDLVFDANFPPNMLMAQSQGHTDATITDFPAEGRREVSVTGHAVIPLIFMRIFGGDTVRVEAGARASRRDVNVMLVIDRSGSMVLAPGPPWPQLQDSAKFFVDQFDTTADRMGLTTFGTSSRVDYGMQYAPGVDFKTAIKQLIDDHQAYNANRTNTSLGLYRAYKELLDLNDTLALNAIVFFTDGQPTAFSNYFDVRVPPSPKPYSDISPAFGVVFTGQTLSNIAGLFSPLATGVPANEGGSHDIYRPSWMHGNFGQVETLLQPTIGPGLRHFRPEGPNSLPEFRIDLGPNPVDMSGNTLINGNSSQRGTEVRDLAENASLQIASAARNPATLNEGIRIYGVGLGGYLGAARHDFMKDLANTKDAPNYDSSQVAGIYVYSPGPAQLRQAFQTVASEIFRLIQ